MNINWKWILGIALGLLVLALVGYGFFMLGQTVSADLLPGGYDGRGFGGRMPMHGFGGRGFDGGFGFMPSNMGLAPFGMGFMLFGGLFRLAIPLALVGLVIWFAYQQGKKAGINTPAEPAEPKA